MAFPAGGCRPRGMDSAPSPQTAITKEPGARHAPIDELRLGPHPLPLAFGDDVHEGDVFLLNDPYFGGSHLPDLTAFVPVFVEGALAFWTETGGAPLSLPSGP